jgi:hypothetical protein
MVGGWMRDAGFPCRDGERWDPDNFSQDRRAANGECRWAWGCLDFRHTFGSQLAMEGESLYKIATLWANSPEICRRHYASLSLEALCSNVEYANSPSTACLAQLAG